jgi:hypothetical protein
MRYNSKDSHSTARLGGNSLFYCFLARLVYAFWLLVAAYVNVQGMNAQGNVQVQPDCIVNFQFTAVGTQQFGNLALTGCQVWYLTYSSTGFSALSLAVQDAPDNGGVPGSWVNWAGTVVSGSNPNTATTSAATALTGFYPWVRVNLTSATGTGRVSGTLYGWKSAAGGSGGGGGGGSTTVTNLPVCQSTSATLKTAPITLTGSSGSVQIIAASGSTAITLCSLTVSVNTTANLSLLYGTGSNCGSGTTYLTSTAGFNSVLAIALDQPIPIPASQAFCISSSVVVTGGGLVTYVQQ